MIPLNAGSADAPVRITLVTLLSRKAIDYLFSRFALSADGAVRAPSTRLRREKQEVQILGGSIFW